MIVTVHPVPSAGTISGKNRVCPGDTIILNSSVTGGTWSTDNSLIATVNGAGIVEGLSAGVGTITYTFTNSCGTIAGTVAVSVLDQNECNLAANNLVAGLAAELTIYPNPNNGSFNLKLTSATDEQVSVTITNVIGQKVKEITTVTNNNTNIIMEQSAVGTYFVSAVTEHGTYNMKIIIQ